MAIKKSELYSSLWAGCDELRGSMDASQYKDYVLVLLFMKYVSDKGGALVEIPVGGSFKDMVKLKGQADIGDKINKIIGALAKANDLTGVITVADFNDDEKLGKGKDKGDRLSNLIEIFEKPELDFSSNQAEGDDILGDAYEYLMRHFATESGKSKGQFYTPAEVSRIMAKVIGINPQNTTGQTTVYDPTCGSGSLLLKVADEAGKTISIYGQENDNATRALAVMNMWLHGNPVAEIVQGNTLSSPQFTDDMTGEIKQHDYAVSNPPFSHKAWTNGWDPAHDIYKRFAGYDSLPPNLFYGTGIAACLVVIDKEDAGNRKDLFMIDASKGFIKDGNKNRLREQDIHKIVDTYNNRIEIPGYSRIIPVSEMITLFTGRAIKQGETLLFFDEIQECPKAIMALRYFFEEMPELHVIGAGSLLEFTLKAEDFRMPVGRIQYLYMFPLSFGEFLNALGENALYSYISQLSNLAPIPDSLHNKLIDYTRKYFIVGGMPAVVNEYIQTRDILKCQRKTA